MALYDLADETVLLPSQLVMDTSLLLAMRTGDDNPHAEAAQSFLRRVSERISSYQMIAWLPIPVLQECYHIILANGLRNIWQNMAGTSRPANWLKMYKDHPELLDTCMSAVDRFRQLIAAIPLTPVRPEDLASGATDEPLEDRLHYFVSAYRLLPQDALILAETERLGVTGVATLDRDWQRVTDFDIYTCSLD